MLPSAGRFRRGTMATVKPCLAATPTSPYPLTVEIHPHELCTVLPLVPIRTVTRPCLLLSPLWSEVQPPFRVLTLAASFLFPAHFCWRGVFPSLNLFPFPSVPFIPPPPGHTPQYTGHTRLHKARL